MAYYNTIAESNNFIVLDDYEKYSVLNEPSVVYQTEASLEHEFIQDLRNQGYEYLPDLNTPEALLANVRTQLQALNDVEFTDSEWDRYVEEYLDKPSDSLVEKTRKLQDDYIYDFVFTIRRRTVAFCATSRTSRRLNDSHRQMRTLYVFHNT